MSPCVVGGEIGEPSVILSSYLRDIYICVLSFFATLPLRGQFATWGTCPAEPSAISVGLARSDNTLRVWGQFSHMGMCSQFCLSLRPHKSRLFWVLDALATLFCLENFPCDVGNR
jgi:hypothetical protein